ncbi:MAG TPA: hypothetical protein VEV41_20235 [Terriglobales bacterium]|nr:hypothetical protein [Terriglobales bacterium]
MWTRILFVSALLVLCPVCLAQTDQKSWTTTDQQSPSGNWNPTRSSTTHTENSGRTVDTQSVQRLGPDGRHVPYLDTEKETIRVNATTTRTIERAFARNPDGGKQLMQVTEEETRTLPGGDQKVVRTTSNPDGNGQLQVIRREMQSTHQTGPDSQEISTTVLSPDINGGLAPSLKAQERRLRSKDTVQYRKSTLLPDGNGNWQLSEVREGVTREDGKERTNEENVLRPGSDGKLALTERTVTKESESGPGEKRQTVESYSTQVPGGFGDGSLQLNQRVTTLHQARPQGGESTVQEVEQRNPGSPTQSPRLTQRTIDIVRPTLGGAREQTRTIQSLDPNGNVGVVWIDTGHLSGSPTIQVDTKKNDKPAVQVNTTSTSKPR